MNIKQAKQDIKNAVTAYLARDKFGSLIIPVERQRPIFLMGAPGIGKTAVMEQIARELNIGLVSYSMTHHTRQSALGLPFITEKNYGGDVCKVSEYTMSEIIASVYDMIELTGVKEGILFLDEINCVSETLSPVMLQFLQYKTFGRHRVPEGWIIVTAGNPPEYNNSVREFDIATWDRLKRIDVEPDYKAWKEYALTKGIHPAIVTYLDIKKDDFYKIETTVDGKSFVTARGWSDLSDIIGIYEQKELPVNEGLVSQYLQNKKIADSFAVYYDLFRKYQSDYQIDRILSGKADDSIAERAKAARFDERLSLLGLIIDGLLGAIREADRFESGIAKLFECLKIVKFDLKADKVFTTPVERQTAAVQQTIDLGKKSGNLSREREYVLSSVIEALNEEKQLLLRENPDGADEAFNLIKTHFNERRKQLEALAAGAAGMLSNAFAFCERAFGKESQELLILVTELTANQSAARFINTYGCKEYFENNKNLMFYERQREIKDEINKLKLDG